MLLDFQYQSVVILPVDDQCIVYGGKFSLRKLEVTARADDLGNFSFSNVVLFLP